MKMKRCGKCFTDVQTTAKHCPNCGSLENWMRVPDTALAANPSQAWKPEIKVDLSKTAAAANRRPSEREVEKKSGDTAVIKEREYFEIVEALLHKSIVASNRTTHAVRALGVFLFGMLTAAFVGIVLFYLSQSTIDPQDCQLYGDHCSGIRWLENFAISLISFGWIGALFAGRNELSRSNLK